ncbi:MAG: hypothetical protein M1817_002633 [Caeruleum heppii]|nr:MAG: hypothetical protein M1817_002633 [Caeruleum heppii]
MTDRASIEATNKLRQQIGLAPLPVPGDGPVFKDTASDSTTSDDDDPGSTLESRQAASYDNYKQAQAEADARAKRDAKNEAIKKARDAARRFAKLEGKGLGDIAEGAELDTKTWLVQQKKRQKKLEKARKLEQELADRDEQAEYTAADLAGVKVGHELNAFEDDGEQVLTLKDTTINENEDEGDELENLELRERERLAERMEFKKKKPVYNPMDMEDGERTILGQYDEEIDGKKQKRFTLDEQGQKAERADGALKVGQQFAKSKLVSLDLDLGRDATSDYVDPSEVKVRKPKKKKAKSTRQKAADEDDIFPITGNGTAEDQMEVEIDTANSTTAPSKKRTHEDTFVDDEDLQAALAIQRRTALKKRKKMRPEDVARQLREEGAATPRADDANDPTKREEEAGLVIDETSEFVANLQKPTMSDRHRRGSSHLSNGRGTQAPSPDAGDSDGDVDMEGSYNDVEEEDEKHEDRFKRESATPAAPEMTSTGLSDESTLNEGIGATLSMLTQRGLIKTSASGDINALHRDRQKFLADKHRKEAEAEARARAQRERDRASGKLDRMSAREKEAYAQQENKTRDTFESRAMAEIFSKEYRPDVDIRYTDEFGRAMNQKEAFKHLSHQFHGKGSGKQKTEKRLKKIEDEKKREAMSSLDSSLSTGMNNAMGATARKNRQAGVRLA